jgi:hypothetical protein
VFAQAAIYFVTPGSIDDATDNIISPVPGSNSSFYTPVSQCVDILTCPAGVANEWDWAVALSEFRRNTSSTPSFALIFGMLREYYETGSWEANGETNPGLFWSEFASQMMSHLGSLYTAWATEAANWEIDQ